ncbi:MAG TPA: hypothetical protein ENJ45_06355 [Phaeodactylibacter sp.]|nr:hypothetical protein [Phaeodactylibacter sp.]
MHRLSYYGLRLFIFLFSLLPFRLLYFLSDGLRWLFFYIMKYRFEVMKQNLENSFPEKSPKEIRRLIWDSYGNLCDILLEGIKGFSLSPEESVARYRFTNPEVVNRFYEGGKSVIIVAAHYANWEWGVQASGLQLMHYVLGIVAPIKNPYINHYIQHGRIFDKVGIAMVKETRSTFEQYRDRLTAFVLVTDQSPSNLAKAYWVEFLHQKTACLHGADSYARAYGYPVIFSEQRRVRRGFYEVTFHLLEATPQKSKEGQITQLYMKKLEEVILKKPEDWLWSHRRWKHPYKETYRLLK